MFSIPTLFGPHCDCCGAIIDLHSGDDCPHCGYPVDVTKEERFLEESISDLQRVIAYGGARATVAGLLQRYQLRYNRLRQQRFTVPASPSLPVAAQLEARTHPSFQLPVNTPNSPAAKASTPLRDPDEHVVRPTAQASLAPLKANNQPPVSSPPTESMFSFRSFFADQTINIVSALGAFLILIGSLSFVATTTNLFLSFLVIFVVHLLFAIVGLRFSQFTIFRFIARVYTTIFALLVPLVGFSAYRLLAGQFIQLSAPTIVAIAALYAALVYAFLAVSQQFKLFGYLAATALVLADFACAYSLHVDYCWWPVLLAPFAIAALLNVKRGSHRVLLNGNAAILDEPMRVLMYACIVALCIDITYIYLYLFAIGVFISPSFEHRLAGATVLIVLLLWTIAYVWTTKRFAGLAVLPYQFVAVIIAFAFAYSWQAAGYGLLFTAVAVFYHVGSLLARQPLHRFAYLRRHSEGIVLALVAVVPFLVAPNTLPLLLVNGAILNQMQIHVDGNTFLALLALLVSCAVTVSIVLAHTGFQRIPARAQTAWPWLLLLSGLLFTWAYGLAIILLNAQSLYAFLVLTLLLFAATIALRRFVGVQWSNPLEVVVLGCAILTILLSVSNQGSNISLALLLLFALLSYTTMFYQRRVNWLFISFLFALLSLSVLLQHPRLELLLGVALPCVAVGFAKARQPFSFPFPGGSRTVYVSPFGWEWPLLLFGLLCGIGVCVQDAFAPVSTMQLWLGIAFSVPLELACLAIVWYIVAAFARMKWWLLIAGCLAIVSLFNPSNSFIVLLYIPFVAALLALAVSQFTERTWAIPLYVVAVLAAVRIGFAGYAGGDTSLAIMPLLGFACLIYVIGVVEDETFFLGLAPCFAFWSVFNDVALLGFGDLYLPPVVALVCALLGVVIGKLAYLPVLKGMKNGVMLRYSLPFYVTALACGAWTGLLGMFTGGNFPFMTAVPDALLLFALVAYLVVVIERQSSWLWLVAVFAIGGMLFASLTPITAFGSPPIWFTTYYLAGIALVTGLLGAITGRFVKLKNSSSPGFTWSWPWYLVSLLTIIVTLVWNYGLSNELSGSIVYGSIFAFIVLTLVITLVERRFVLLTLPLALGIWLIAQTHWQLWQQMMALSVLFFLVFAVSSVWLTLTSSTQPTLYRLLGLVGQVFVLLLIMAQGGLATNAGILGHVGVAALLLLATQLSWYSWVQPMRLHWLLYCAGLLVALAIPWELVIQHQVRIELLTLAPATYLIVVAPFLARDERVPSNHRFGQLCSTSGSILLLVPTLWSSFGDTNVGPTLILAGEAFALLLLGVGTRVRFFVLSGAALVVVGAMHALFLPSLGLPPSLALTIMGVTLLALATCLSLARHRIQTVWTHLE